MDTGPSPHTVRTIIKLGGAAITHKSILECSRPDVLTSLASSIAACLDGQPASDIIVVHGAGSFGHHQAKAYGVANGGLDQEQVRLGAALTHASVAKLNGLVVDVLTAAGLPAVGISPMNSGWTTRNKQVEQDGVSAVTACLAAGLLPVLHGDVVFDSQLGCTILSGDTLVSRLAAVLRPQQVVFLTNVAGVYDKSPELPGARLLKTIYVDADGGWKADGVDDVDLASVSEHDVTGGISTKVAEAAQVAGLGIPVVIALAGGHDGAAACTLSSDELRKGHVCIDEQGKEVPWLGTLVLPASHK